MTALVPASAAPVLAERGGTQLRTPLPTAIVDTREQNPLSIRASRDWYHDPEESCAPDLMHELGPLK
jgi:hypothetical protein